MSPKTIGLGKSINVNHEPNDESLWCSQPALLPILDLMYTITYTSSMKVPKVKSATELRANLFETLREVQEGEPQLVTHTKGSDGVILISQAKLNALLEENDTLK